MKFMGPLKTFIDCGSGVAGDMLLGALFGLGLSKTELENALKPVIPAKNWHLEVRQEERRMWPAWTLKVRGDRPFTSTDRMLKLILEAPLPPLVRKRAHAILVSLCQAEHKAHGHAHGHFDPKGLGRLDTLVDVIGNSWGFWKLGIEGVIASPLNTGRIAPATAQLLKKAKVPVFSDTAQWELATPTGTAILTHMARRYETLPRMKIMKAGYGAGALERDGKPNVLVIYQGKTA